MTTVLDRDLSQAVADAVDESIDEVFGMMAGHPAEQVSLHLLPATEKHMADKHPLTVTLSLSGDLQGIIGLCLSGEAARQWTADIIGEAADDINQDVIDAAGELGNLIVGGAKRRLAPHDLKMGLPSVILAGREAFVFPRRVHPIYVSYRYAETSFDVIIALAPQG